LSGLDGPIDRARVAINLDTHIVDVVSLAGLERLDDFIQCGHSYGGIVIAGAADRLAKRILTLVFLDAIVPADGDSVWSLWPHAAREFIANCPDGLVTSPPPAVDSRARAHPLATFLQSVRLGANAYAARSKVYALCATNKGSPFEAFYTRLADNPAWIMRKMACGHDFMNQAPTLALQVILEAANLP